MAILQVMPQSVEIQRMRAGTFGRIQKAEYGKNREAKKIDSKAKAKGLKRPLG